MRNDNNNKLSSYGDKIIDQTIVEKILRSITSKFDHVIATIEESRDLSVFKLDELMGSLHAHEWRINRSVDTNDEKAFNLKEVANRFDEGDYSRSRCRGRGGFQGCCCCYGRGRRRFEGQRYSRDRTSSKNRVQCYRCKGYGHIKVEC